MKIRKAVSSDAQQIHEIELLCFADPWSEASILEDIEKNEKAMYFVAVDHIEDEAEGKGKNGEQILGYVGVWDILGEGHITNVAVRPDARRRHIADALIDALSQAFKVATLEVRSSNEAAIALYEKHGFEKVGLRKGYYDNNGEDAIIMWRGLE